MEFVYLTASAGAFWGLAVLAAERLKPLAVILVLCGSASAVLGVLLSLEAVPMPLAALAAIGNWSLMALAYKWVEERVG